MLMDPKRHARVISAMQRGRLLNDAFDEYITAAASEPLSQNQIMTIKSAFFGGATKLLEGFLASAIMYGNDGKLTAADLRKSVVLCGEQARNEIDEFRAELTQFAKTL